MCIGVLTALAAGSACAQPMAVVDQRERRVELARPPSRIVTIPMPAASMLVAIDGSPRRLVGMNPASLTAVKGQVLGAIYPALNSVFTDVVKGGQFTPNLEALLALRPDLVFQWADQPQDVIAAIERVGLKAYGMRYGTQGELERWLIDLGKIVNAPQKAEALVAYHRRMHAMLESRSAALPAQQRPRVLYLQRFDTGLRPAGTGSYMDFQIRLAGGTNAAAALPRAGIDATFEQIVTWNPDVVLLGNWDTAQPAQLFDDPKWRSLRAVRDKRVYKLPLGGYRWDPPSHESPLAWLWLHALLHPADVKSWFDLRREMRDLYRTLYSHALAEDEIDAVLGMKMNAGSLGYEQFARR